MSTINRTNVTISATVSGRFVTRTDVESALRYLASDNGVRLDSLAIVTESLPGLVSVEMTEAERDAFAAWRASQAPAPSTTTSA